LAAGQQVQNSAQQFGDAARGAIAPWQSAAAGDLRAPQNPGPQGYGPQNTAQPNYGPAVATRQAPVGVVGSTASPTGMTNPFFGQQPAAPPANTAAWQPQPQQQVPAAAGQFVPASQAPPICLDGYCAVTLLETKKWKKADPQFGAVHRGRTYLFADADQQKKFLANPDGFAPVLSGYDPVRFATTGQLVEGSRAFGVITPGDNRIFLFADKVSLEQFERSPRDYVGTAYQAMQRSESTPTYR
jgi:protein disulfide-isomerase